jgi:hypothetical protein
MLGDPKIQQVAMKRDESLSPSLSFVFCRHYVFMTAESSAPVFGAMTYRREIFALLHFGATWEQ